MACVGGVPGAGGFVRRVGVGGALAAGLRPGRLGRSAASRGLDADDPGDAEAVGEHAVEQRESSGRRGMRMAQVQPGTELGDDGIQQPVHVGGRFQALAKAA